MNFYNGEHIQKSLSREDFVELVLKVFEFQAVNNPVYADYLRFLRVDFRDVNSIDKIPFLPIEFFKTHRIITRYYDLPDDRFLRFRSSGTTGMTRSTHYIYIPELYEKAFLSAFEMFYGSVKDYVILALLPSYLERGDSSLVYMVNRLIDLSASDDSGFYLYNHEDLYQKLLLLRDSGKKTVLFGVSFALLDFAEKYTLDFPDLIVIETGGMKGRKKEMVRDELHGILKEAFGVPAIHSEYGMTELLSQAYSHGEGRFFSPPWMQVIIRDMNDPFEFLPSGRSGGINIIDLANVYSCAFIETKDIGRVNKDGSFEVLGRFDNSDLRGCNLMIA